MSRISLRERAKKVSLNRSKSLICVIEHPKYIDNLTGIIRTAEVLGVSKVYIIDDGRLKLPDWQSMRNDSRLVKLSASGIKWLFVKKFSSTAECLKHLSKKNFTNIGTSPHMLGKKNFDLSEGKYTQHHLAVWFGNETIGLSKEALDACDFCVQIPVYGIVESLNISSCAAIVLHHIVEKRRTYTKVKLQKRRS